MRRKNSDRNDAKVQQAARKTTTKAAKKASIATETTRKGHREGETTTEKWSICTSSTTSRIAFVYPFKLD